MQIEEYFEFLAPDDIRIKGHRIGIESILYEYLYNAQTAEEMAARFPTLTLEQIHATILYYLQHKPQIEKYLADWLEHGEQMRKQQAQHPTPTMLKLRKIRANRNAKWSACEYVRTFSD